MGSMSDGKVSPAPGAPRDGRRQCLHVLFPSAATWDLAFLVQEVDDRPQHSHHEDADNDCHNDHPFALWCLLI